MQPASSLRQKSLVLTSKQMDGKIKTIKSVDLPENHDNTANNYIAALLASGKQVNDKAAVGPDSRG